MSRIFLVGELRFPNGSASANYVEQLALAFAKNGMEVFVISTPNSNSCENQILKLENKNVHFIPLVSNKNKFTRHVTLNYRFGHAIISTLKECNINHTDFLITYNSNPFTLSQCLSYANLIGCKICGCITERLPKTFFNNGIKGFIEYKKYIYATERILPNFDLIFPISYYLDNFYKELGANTFRLPILADAESFDIDTILQKKEGKKKYIFPANGKIKDKLSDMINAFLIACNHENAELHLTGISPDKVISLCPNVKENIDSNIFIHGWMSYSSLLELYDCMDFLLLARDIDQMTLANFPSKVPEVMCHGVIPIVSRVGDYTSYFLTDNFDSIVFDGCSCDTCVEAILRSIELSRTDMSIMARNAYVTVLEKLNLKTWGNSVLRAIDKIKNKR